MKVKGRIRFNIKPKMGRKGNNRKDAEDAKVAQRIYWFGKEESFQINAHYLKNAVRIKNNFPANSFADLPFYPFYHIL